MSFGELDSTVSGVQFVEHGGSDRSWDDYPALFEEEPIVQGLFVIEGLAGACYNPGQKSLGQPENMTNVH